MADAGLIRDGSDDEDAARPRPTTLGAEKIAVFAKTITRRKRKPLYAELGAGRGYLSHFLLDAYGPLDLVLVEREAVKSPALIVIGEVTARHIDQGRHSSGSWDLERQTQFFEALGPSFRWGDGEQEA